MLFVQAMVLGVVGSPDQCESRLFTISNIKFTGKALNFGWSWGSLFDKADVFCKFGSDAPGSLEQTAVTTSTKVDSNGLPDWGTESWDLDFGAAKDSSSSNFRIACFDKDRYTSDDLIGNVNIAWADLPKTEKHWKKEIASSRIRTGTFIEFDSKCIVDCAGEILGNSCPESNCNSNVGATCRTDDGKGTCDAAGRCINELKMEYKTSCHNFINELFEQVKPDDGMLQTVANDMNLQLNPLTKLLTSVLTVSTDRPALNFDELKLFYLKQSGEKVYRDTICRYIYDNRLSTVAFIEANKEKLRYFIHRVYLLEAHTIAYLSDKRLAHQMFESDMMRPVIAQTNSFKSFKIMMINRKTKGYFGDREEGGDESSLWVAMNIDEAAILSNWKMKFSAAAETAMRLSLDPVVRQNAVVARIANVTSPLVNDPWFRTLGCGREGAAAGTTCDHSFVMGRRSDTTDLQKWKEWVQLYVVWNTAFGITEVANWELMMAKLFIPSVLAPNDHADWLAFRLCSLWKSINDQISKTDDENDADGFVVNRPWKSPNEPEMYQYALEMAHEIGLPELSPSWVKRLQGKVSYATPRWLARTAKLFIADAIGN